MSLATQTTQQIADSVIAQLSAAIGQSIPILPKSFCVVLAKAMAGVFILVYRYAGFMFLQLFVAYASFDETTVLGKKLRPLVEWGRLVGEGDPLAATGAELSVTVLVTNPVGSLVAGSQLVRSQTGVIYSVVADVPLVGTSVTAIIRAVSDQDGNGGVGTIGNLNAGDIVSFANPLSNIRADTTVVAQTKTGADAETPDAYRLRVLRRFQARPQGGAYADYRDWAVEVNGIIAAYPYASNLPGEIDVYIEADFASSGSADGIPTDAQVTAVQDNINLNAAGVATRRPVNAAVNVKKITRSAVDVLINGLAPTSSSLVTSLGTGMDEFLRSREPFIVGLSVLPRTDRVTQASVSGIVDNIASAAGATVTSVVVTPGPAYTLAHGEKTKIGVVSYG